MLSASHEELLKRNAELERENAELRAENATLREQFKELERKLARLLNQSSRTTHQAPSTDKKRYPKLRGKSKRKQGGQKGHKGHTLELVKDPDKVVHCPVERDQCSCGHALTDVRGVPGEHAQVHDLPKVRLEVTEYIREVKICPKCRQRHRGMIPQGVTPGASYGPRYQGFLSYLMQQQFVPFERLADISEDLLGHRPSEGSLYRMQQRLFDGLAGVEAAITMSLQDRDLLHADETGCFVSGKNHWVHVVSDELLTHYSFHGGRGREAHRELGILPSFAGLVVHDQYASYFDPGYGWEHVACNAHIKRELLGVWEATGQRWAQELAELLVDAHVARQHQPLDHAQQEGISVAFDSLVRQGLALHALPVRRPGQRGRLKRSKALNLLLRLELRKDDVLRFTRDPTVPFDNNQAERDLRMVKLKQKISGGFRSLLGAMIFCRIRGYISTLRKQGLDVLEALTAAFEGKPVMPALTRAGAVTHHLRPEGTRT
jgi:transposase